MAKYEMYLGDDVYVEFEENCVYINYLDRGWTKLNPQIMKALQVWWEDVKKKEGLE